MEKGDNGDFEFITFTRLEPNRLLFFDALGKRGYDQKGGASVARSSKRKGTFVVVRPFK